MNAKVQKYLFDVEIIDRELMGVAVLTLNAPLNQAELTKIKETIEGQSSDGFGEDLEQREIKCNGKKIGMAYDMLIGGDYRLLLEPFAFDWITEAG